MLKEKKKESESGDGFAYHKCPNCGLVKKFGKKNPVYTDVSNWLKGLKCKCGYRSKI
jgi:hypothetical protein